MKKITVYKIEDDAEVPQLVDRFDHAVEIVKELVYAIDFGYPIKITKLEMTQKEYDKIPEL